MEGFDQFVINRAVEVGNGDLPIHENSGAVWVLVGPDKHKYQLKAADLSASDLVLFVDKRLPEGAWAKVDLRCGIVFGQISNIASYQSGFRVNVRVDELLPR
jgi:hypothetical protein